MPPMPCGHCGLNYMRQTPDPETPNLCNCCLIKENIRNPQFKECMEPKIDIKITCPIKTHNEIEEFCINQGITLSAYFLQLHRKETHCYGISPVDGAFAELENVDSGFEEQTKSSITEMNEISDKSYKKKNKKN